MKRFPAVASIVLASITASLSSKPAFADTLSLTLANPTESLPFGTGGTLSFFGTVSAPSSNSGLEYLNGDGFSVSSPAALDDTGYVNNFPLDLAPGGSFTGPLFTITIPTLAPAGDYTGAFTIIGGSTDAAVAPLATVAFDAVVTPEPSTLLLLGTGLGSLTVLRRRWNKQLAN